MLQKLTSLLFIVILFIGCKSTQTITLPEQVIEIEDPNKIHVRPVYNASNTKHFDLIHTKLAVQFNWEKAYMYGKAEITLVPHFYTQNQLILDARGMDLHKVQLMAITEGIPTLTDFVYDYTNDKITINLPTPYTKNDTVRIFIDYTSKPNELIEGGSSAITSDKGLYFINEKGRRKR